ncbi:hypothetical protein [Nocardiopsis valliformis]|uniref:hypothetical protein n=1 Tax=Nocardiopsis valliformis TaxID=239974 RepID=UPI000348B109|nr:hypothetical protein [Nocardiopsis valliformis]
MSSPRPTPNGALVILVVIDGLHAFANSDTRVEHPVLNGLVQSVAEHELDLPRAH